MKPIAILGVVLIVLGIAGLFISHVSWTETKPVAKLGPLQVNSQEDHTVWIPTAAGVMAVLAGRGSGLRGKTLGLSPMICCVCEDAYSGATGNPSALRGPAGATIQ